MTDTPIFGHAPAYVTPLEADDYAALTSGRNVMVTHGKATLVMRRFHRHGDTPEARFVMTGPSGGHSLLVIATDLARLNAHWIAFAGHPLNLPDAPEGWASIDTSAA